MEGKGKEREGREGKAEAGRGEGNLQVESKAFALPHQIVVQIADGDHRVLAQISPRASENSPQTKNQQCNENKESSSMEACTRRAWSGGLRSAV